MDHNQQGGGGQGRRGHFHRGRRGSDRRGQERGQERRQHQGQQGQHQGQDQGHQPPREHVDIDQLMRDIRGRIGKATGIELSAAQIQELAARRLEAVLDPQSLNPALLDTLRAATGTTGSTLPKVARVEPKRFDGAALFKKVFGPILKLFFDPAPIAAALDEQSRLAAEAATREAERDRLQAEWNALHYELLRRVVRESARNTIELQGLALQVESLAAKVDFNERRVRGIEGIAHQPQQSRHAPRPQVSVPQPSTPVTPGAAVEGAAPAASPEGGTPAGDGPRRRRRRRRGRRGSASLADGTTAAADGGAAADDTLPDTDEGIEPDDGAPEDAAVDVLEETVHGGAVHAAEPEPAPAEPARVTPVEVVERVERVDAEPLPPPASTDEPVDR